MMNVKNFYKAIWFIGGFAIGITLISAGHAALPKRATPETSVQPAQSASLVTEINSKPSQGPDLEQDYNKLSQMEARYAESWQQQQKLRSATNRVAGSGYTKSKKVKRN